MAFIAVERWRISQSRALCRIVTGCGKNKKTKTNITQFCHLGLLRAACHRHPIEHPHACKSAVKCTIPASWISVRRRPYLSIVQSNRPLIKGALYLNLSLFRLIYTHILYLYRSNPCAHIYIYIYGQAKTVHRTVSCFSRFPPQVGIKLSTGQFSYIPLLPAFLLCGVAPPIFILYMARGNPGLAHLEGR